MTATVLALGPLYPPPARAGTQGEPHASHRQRVTVAASPRVVPGDALAGSPLRELADDPSTSLALQAEGTLRQRSHPVITARSLEALARIHQRITNPDNSRPRRSPA